jgi:hypothetical protein
MYFRCFSIVYRSLLLLFICFVIVLIAGARARLTLKGPIAHPIPMICIGNRYWPNSDLGFGFVFWPGPPGQPTKTNQKPKRVAYVLVAGPQGSAYTYYFDFCLSWFVLLLVCVIVFPCVLTVFIGIAFF